PHVAVADDEDVVLGLPGEVVQGADLVVSADHLGADHERNVTLGEVVPQALDDRDGRVPGVAHAAEDLPGRVIESAETGEVSVEVGGRALQRFEDGDRREGLGYGGSLAKKSPGRVQGEEVIQGGDEEKTDEEQEEDGDHEEGAVGATPRGCPGRGRARWPAPV